MRKQILVNVGSNYLASFFGMALGFFLVPFLIGKLGKDAYGLTVLAESTVAFFEILTISVRVALSRHATFALAQGHLEDFSEYLSTGRVILYGSAAIVLALGLGVSLHFTDLFRVPAVYALDSKTLFFLVTLAFTISIPNIVFWSVLYAKQRFDLINLSMSSGLILRAVAIFLYYTWAPRSYQTLSAYGCIYFAMTFAQNFMIYRSSRKEMPGLEIGRRFFRRARVREILSFSVHTSVSRASSLLYQETAQILINVLWGPAYNTLYSIALKFPNMMRRVFVEPSWALTPTFTELAAKDDKARMETLFYLYSKVLSVSTVPLSFALIFFSESIIRSWVGPDFEMAWKLLPLFSVSLIVSIPFSMSGCLFNAYGKVKVPSLVSLAVALVNLALCVALGYWLDWKLFGIAWSAIASSLLTAVFFYPYYACLTAGISVRRYWFESFLKPFTLACFLLGPAFWTLRGYAGGRLSFSFVSAASILSGLYYVLAYVFLFTASERMYIQDLFAAILRNLNKTKLIVSGGGNA